MSNETDKLAAEMKKMQPSKAARKRGIEAAMAVFDREFTQENAAEKTTVEETIASPSQSLNQGSTAEPRPTGYNTRQTFSTARVQTFGRYTMKTLNKILNVKPQTLMMGGTSMAAIFACLVYFQSSRVDTGIISKEMRESLLAQNNAEVPVKTPVTTPVIETPPAENSTAAPTTTITPLPVVKAPVTAATVTPPKIKTATSTETTSNIVVIERRVVKTPASTQERLVPSVTKQGTRRVRKADGSFETVTETVVVQSATTELISIPPVYETVRETIEIGADGSTRVMKSETVPSPMAANTQGGITSVNNLLSTVRKNSTQTNNANKQREAEFRARRNQQQASLYSSQQGYIANTDTQPKIKIAKNGETLQMLTTPAITKQVSRRVIKDAAHTVERTTPAVTKQVSRRVVQTPASAVERFVPAITKEVTVRVKAEDGTFKDVTKTFVIQEASTELVTTPATFKTVTETVVVQEESITYVTVPATYITITETVVIPPSNVSNDQFENYESNPITSAVETPVSTFSIDVDTASYSFLRASLNRGQLPPAGAIRLEEMINYFPYDYTAPKSADEPFKANVTVTPTPWNPDTKLMHIGIKGYVPPADARPSSNIVFLIDTSGSMRSANKLPLLINSFKLLLDTLDEDDTVSIVTYAGRAGTVLEPTPANEKDKIKAALSRLRAGGSTAGAAGLELAYLKAAESFDDEGINRVILATDGDFNVGFSSPDAMKTFIKKKRATGIFLSVLGFGNGNYNDHLMQSLAQNGNGVAAYIDTLAEANKVLANEAGSALITIAKDVKIQVEFNPQTISEYRLIGYETRALKREDFNNDKVDAGDIGAGHTVTAIYEITPAGSPSKAFDPLRYGARKSKQRGAKSGEYAFVKIRHKLPKSDTSTLQTFPVGPKQQRSLKRSSDDTRFAIAVAAFGQKLRGDTYLSGFSYDETIKLASRAKGDDENGYRSEFIQLVRLAKNLQE